MIQAFEEEAEETGKPRLLITAAVARLAKRPLIQDMKLQRLESECDEPPRASTSQSRDSLNILVESIPW